MNQSIRWKLTLFVSCVVALTAASLSVASYVFARRTLRQQINDRLTVVVADRQKLLFGFIQEFFAIRALVIRIFDDFDRRIGITHPVQAHLGTIVQGFIGNIPYGSKVRQN